MTEHDRIIGIIGLGNMGGAMGASLARGGASVIGYDPNPARAASAAKDGIGRSQDVAAVARAAQIIITSLPSAEVAKSVLAEILRNPVGPRIIVETSTLSVADKEGLLEQLAGSPHRLLDCPLSGTSAQARVQDLVVLASGDPDAIATISDALQLIGRVRNVGTFGAGTRVKLIANLLVAIHNVSTAECLALGVHAGLNPQMLVEVLGGGAGGSRMLQVRGPIMASRTYQPATMTLDLWAKDLNLITEFAQSCHSATPLFDVAKAAYAQTASERGGADDTASVFEQFVLNSDARDKETI